MAELWKGAPVAAALNEETARLAAALTERGVTPTLALLRVGAREDDIAYERSAEKRCAALGIAVRRVTLPEDVSQTALEETAAALNADAAVHGVLLFRPLPKRLDEAAVCRLLVPEKDVDGITPGSLAAVFSRTGPGFPPCTAQACVELLKFYGAPISGARATVVGRSLVVGRPLAMLLLADNATVTICHTRTRDLPAETRQAEILLVATGHTGTLGAEHVSPGQIVVDVGTNWDEEAGRLRGDTDFEAVEPIVRAITPVPGGVGAVTTALLARHTAQAAAKAAGLADILEKGR